MSKSTTRISPCDFIAAITQHIPDMIAPTDSNLFQLVRYYGWYSNKMRGQRNQQAESREGEPPGDPFPDYSRKPVMDYDLSTNG